MMSGSVPWQRELASPIRKISLYTILDCAVLPMFYNGSGSIRFPASLKKRLCIFGGLILTTADFRRVNILKISLPVTGSTANSRQIERHEQPHHHRKYRQQ